MEVKKDVDVLIKEVAACNTLTAEEDFALTKAVQDKGTDCDEMKKLHEVYDRFVVSIAKQYLDKGLSLEVVDSPTYACGYRIEGIIRKRTSRRKLVQRLKPEAGWHPSNPVVERSWDAVLLQNIG